MKRLTKQNKIIVGVIALVLTLTVGYALFSETLNINGTAKASGDFNIIFNSVGTITETDTKDTTAVIEKPGQKVLTINAKFDYPSSYVRIPVTIKNTGSIDAVLKGIRTEGIDTTDIKVMYHGIAEDGIVKSNEEKDLEIVITWLETSTKEVGNLKFNIYLDYEQATNTEGIPPEGTDDNIVFPVVNGQLGDNVYYTYDNGTINITGSGPMWQERKTRESGLDFESLAFLTTSEIAKTFSKGNVRVYSALQGYWWHTIGGWSYEELFSESIEVLKEYLMSPVEERGMGLTLEEANYVINTMSIRGIKNINIDEGVTKLRSMLFVYSMVDSLVIPNSVEKLNFEDILGVKVKNLSLGTGATIIGYQAIKNSFIENINIPEGILKFEEESITNVEKLKTLTIPSTVIEISNRALYNNPDLETIVNKTGKAFDWNGILGNSSGTPFETGTVIVNGKTITITK